ncbi:type II secretion system F family protein [Tautonia plasticadhaerens]|uniref:Type II secretion system protein F n=1 Tax=Tautonia plasticadhaerens TaxID=2527974 RepID=A0A518GWV9_9BACT|nr:type II secretion system F family protein [Tautonia plasticadhaerens]QDV33041.1 Type II secretion system protein F [Tautonia plasticadhaerens]
MSDHPADAGRSPDRPPPTGAVARERSDRAPSINDRDAAEFARLIGGAASGGLALPTALRALAEEAESARVRRGLLRLADRVEDGETLGKALEGDGGAIPDHLVGIARAAERSGRVAEVLSEANRFDRISAEMYRRMLIRLSYPTLLLCVFFGVFQLIAIFVIEDYAAIYRDFGVDLPLLSIWLVGASEVLTRAGWAIPAAIALAGVMIWLAALGSTRSNRRRVASGIPVIGSLWRNAAMAEFAGLLALLVECRLPMPEALRLSSKGVRDSDLIVACSGAAWEVERGRSLAEASRQFRLFPRGFDRLLAWSEANGDLPGALRMAAEIYRARDRSQAVLVGIFATAVAVSLVLFGVILIVLGLHLPLVKLISQLSGGPFLFW